MKLGSHIAIMESGRVVQYGQPEEIVLAPASAYVADFVAHMNPLNVLRGASLMTPLDALARRGDDVLLDSVTMTTLDAKGRPASVRIAGRPGRLVGFEDRDMAGADMIVLAPADIKLRTALELRHQTGNPVALVENGRLIGAIGDDEIYRGILRQTGLAE
jgi:glycine betaine/proline transport system ATP-binding protein